MRMDENAHSVSAPLTDDLLCGAVAIARFMGEHITPAMVYRMVAKDQIPHFKKGALLFARKSEIEADFRSEAA